jgi:hypothetical protein
MEILLTGALLGVVLLGTRSWGPGTHIQFTQEVLRRFRRCRSRRPNQDLVLRHPQAFLYGNVAADIINFKAFGGIKNHCHNWNIQGRLLAVASDEAAHAFTLGYLCHLAADTVAHNHFVPYHLVYNFPPRVFAHAYWEALADGKVRDEEWHTLEGLKRSRRLSVFDHMVHEAVRTRAFGLRSNKWIFSNILLLNCRSGWRRIIQGVKANALKHPLDEAFLQSCRHSSLKQILRVFHPRRMPLLLARDPTGRTALQGAARMRRELLRDFGVRSKARLVSRALAYAAYSKLP